MYTRHRWMWGSVVVLVSLLLSSCLSLRMDVHLARKGKAALLDQTFTLGDELAEFMGTEKPSSVFPFPLSEEDFLAAIQPFPGAQLRQWQQKDRVITVRLSFKDNDQLVEYLNATATLGRWQLGPRQLSFDVEPDPENSGYFNGQQFELRIEGPKRFKHSTHTIKHGEIQYKNELDLVLRNGMHLEADW